MKLRVKKIRDGMHPSETVVAIPTSEGDERLTVDKNALGENTTLEIGWPLRQKDNLVLIELPRETQSGAWRVWVPRDALEESMAAA
jgi:hypothetical protein